MDLRKNFLPFADTFNKNLIFADSTQNVGGSAFGGWVNYTLLRYALTKITGTENKEVTENFELLKALFAEIPEELSLALGFWSDPEAVASKILADLVKEIQPEATVQNELPAQEALDAWTDEKTLHIIEKFPVNIADFPDLLALLANTIATKFAWGKEFRRVPNDSGYWDAKELLVENTPFVKVGSLDGEPYIIQWKYSEKRGIKVYTVLGSEKLTSAELYSVLRYHVENEPDVTTDTEDEVQQWSELKPDFATFTKKRSFDRNPQFSLVIPAWSSSGRLELDGLEVFKNLNNEWYTTVEEELSTFQVVKTKYTREGYEAAAVTVTMVGRAAAFPGNEVTEVGLEYNRPFISAAYAVADNVWSEIPLFVNVVRKADEVD